MCGNLQETLTQQLLQVQLTVLVLAKPLGTQVAPSLLLLTPSHQQVQLGMYQIIAVFWAYVMHLHWSYLSQQLERCSYNQTADAAKQSYAHKPAWYRDLIFCT